MDDLLRRALGESIYIETIVTGGLWNTPVDPNQLENVILNLAINARDAMQNGGRLTLELGTECWTIITSHLNPTFRPDSMYSYRSPILVVAWRPTLWHAFSNRFYDKARG